MKTLVLLSATVVLALAALFFLRSRREIVAIRDLTWSEHDGSVSFEFRAVNLTDEPVSASVDLIAERTRESRVGTRIGDAGHGHVDVRLAGKEVKTERGELVLASGIKGSLTLFPYVTVKKPNQASEPTSTAVTPRAYARVAPSVPVAHL